MEPHVYADLKGHILAAIQSLDAAWERERAARAVACPQAPEASDYDPSAPPDFNRDFPFPPQWSHKGVITMVARQLRGTFGTNQVLEAIKEIPAYRKMALDIQKPTITIRLKKMVIAGDLELVSQGSGTRPSLYRRWKA